MQLSQLERELREQAGAILCDPRVLRRVIKHHRRVVGLVPHARTYGIARDALVGLATAEELGCPHDQLPDPVVLVSRPSPREVGARLPAELTTRIWRQVFHARIHLALEKRIEEGALDEVAVRQRIASIGQTAFDEIRAILRHDELVMPPADDREVYIEFAALYVELRHFAPSLLLSTFPGLHDHERVKATLSLDLDVRPLLERGKPASVLSPTAATRALQDTSMPSFSAPATFGLNDKKATPKPISPRAYASLMAKARKAREVGNDVRAALLCSQAALVADEQMKKDAHSAGREALVHLGGRLSEALKSAHNEGSFRAPDWSLLLILGARAAEERAVRYSVEARLLYTLQQAAVASERGEKVVEISAWILSLGKRKAVRELPATRELRIARYLRQAARKVRNVRIGDADRKLLSRLLGWAEDRAEENLRAALRPRIGSTFDAVGLKAQSDPELLARGKVIEELIDYIFDHGFLRIDAVRDALSRNQLKLDDLGTPAKLLTGDELLKCDAALAEALDGIYKRADVYMRALQKISSIPFGTKVGRALTLFAILPLGVSFIAIEGTSHMVNPVLGWFGLGPYHLFTWTSFGVVALVILGLIHSAPFRAVARQVLDIVAIVLATVFFRVPRAILTSAIVRRALARPAVRLVLRRVVVPLGIAGLSFLLLPIEAWYWHVLAAAGILLTTSFVLGSRIGALLEDFVVDQLAPTWQVVSRQWLPGVVRLISRFFSAVMDMLQRVMVRVDEMLRFRQGQNPILVGLKGVLGLLWGILAYIIRLYVTLFIEPEVNPLKHFPVVTVAHKLMIPYAGMIGAAVMTPLEPVFGEVIAGTAAGINVFLFPSIFGFLAWELKENYRLYRATRPDRLPATPVGPHGETMRGLLVAGFHSGTLPKLYERLRRAAQREDETGVLPIRRAGETSRVSVSGLSKFRDGLREIEQGVRRFVERELIAVLHSCRRWRFGKLYVEAVHLSSNRIRVQLGCDTMADARAEITFEEQSGLVLAGIAAPGFIAQLQRDAEQALLFENALGGLYQLAEVDLVREQIEAAIGATSHYDIADDGLLVWPQQDYRTELVYPLKSRKGKAVPPKVRGAAPDAPPPVLETSRLSFQEQAIHWIAWVNAWTSADHEGVAVPRLVHNATILPREGASSVMANDTPLLAETPLAPRVASTVAASPAIHTLAMPPGSAVAATPLVARTMDMANVNVTQPMPERGGDG